MALPINIEELIKNRVVESTRVEYKADWDPEPIIHTITAFANDIDNTGGGYIVVGIVEENGIPNIPMSGLNKDSLDRIQKELLNKCNLIEPRYLPVVEPATIEKKHVLVIWAPGGDDRPYKSPVMLNSDKASRQSGKAYYIRKMASTIRANEREERELISLSRDVPFDDRINPHAEVADMRSSLISEFLHSVDSELYAGSLTRTVLDVATDMKLVRGPAEYRKPINVGLMFFFFNEKPDDFFPYSQIEVVSKPDPTGLDMIEKTFKGPLDRQLRDALSYIKNSIIEEYVTKVPDDAVAIRAFNWPYRAVEEALCNAVYHRSYQIHEPITVTVTPEKMEILSIPGPDLSISDEDLENRVLISSRYRNRRIGDFLKELHMVEGRNTGVPLIIDAMRQNGSDLPSFLTDENRLYFRVILPIHPVFLQVAGKNRRTVVIPPARTKPSRRNREDLRELIIIALRQNELSLRGIASQLGYSKPTDTIRLIVKELIENGEAEYTMLRFMISRLTPARQ